MKQLEENNLTMVDLYCGAGIGAVGFKLAGYEIIDAIDNVQYAVDTYNKNIGNHARVADMRDVESKDVPYADVYVGGFPCKSWSVAGAGLGREDERYGDLGWHFWRLVRENQPKAFMLENVKGIISKKHINDFYQLLSDFSSVGYNVEWKLMNSYDYGVPQLRERVFAVGLREDLNRYFTFPDITSNRKVLRDAIGDLSNPDDLIDYCENKPIKKVFNHSEYFKGDYSTRYSSRNRQKQWNEPSFTIVSQAKQLPLHPEPANYDIRIEDVDKCPPPRRFTVRECLRIQSVPDSFAFSDKVSLNKQYERCSGIPSLIAYKLGIRIAEHLKGEIGQPSLF